MNGLVESGVNNVRALFSGCDNGLHAVRPPWHSLDFVEPFCLSSLFNLWNRKLGLAKGMGLTDQTPFTIMELLWLPFKRLLLVWVLSSTLICGVLPPKPATASGVDNCSDSGYCSNEALSMGSCTAAYSRYNAKRACGNYKSCTNTSAGRYWCSAIFACDNGSWWLSHDGDLLD